MYNILRIYFVLQCSTRHYINTTTTFSIPASVLPPELQSSIFCRLHSQSPSQPVHKICTTVHTSDSFQNTVSSCIFPLLLQIPQVMVLISSPRNMKINLPHSPSDFLLPYILCSPYIAAPSPVVILSVSSSRQYWDHISCTPYYRLSLRLTVEVPFR